MIGKLSDGRVRDLLYILLSLVLTGCFQGIDYATPRPGFELTPGPDSAGLNADSDSVVAMAASPVVSPSPQATVTQMSQAQSEGVSANPGGDTGDDGMLLHTVQSGETLYGLSVQYNIDLEVLAGINSITDTESIMAGQRLIIPLSLANPTSTPDPAITPSETATDAPTLTATASTTPTHTVSPVPTQTATATLSPTETQLPTATPVPPTLTHTPVSSVTITLPAPSATLAMTATVPVPTSSARLIVPTVTLPPVSPTPQPTYPPPPGQVNGLTYTEFIIMPPEVRENVQRIYTLGEELGRQPTVFTRIGDSTIEQPHFMMRFDGDSYNLGDYAYLQRVIDFYRGSFDHESVAVQRGLHTWSVFDPFWAPAGLCSPGETVLHCEIRRTNPSVIFIRLGSNDRGVPSSTEKNLRRIVEFCVINGIVPIMGTKADRFDGYANDNNRIIRELAAEFQVPLWDFDLLAGTIPGRGLTTDQVHMTGFFAHDWRQRGGFTTGHGVHNLTALIALDHVWQVLHAPETAIATAP